MVTQPFPPLVTDWDRMAKADKLGVGWLDLVSIEPFQATKQTVKLTAPDGVEHGSVDVRLVFRPEVGNITSAPVQMLILP